MSLLSFRHKTGNVDKPEEDPITVDEFPNPFAGLVEMAKCASPEMLKNTQKSGGPLKRGALHICDPKHILTDRFL